MEQFCEHPSLASSKKIGAWEGRWKEQSLLGAAPILPRMNEKFKRKGLWHLQEGFIVHPACSEIQSIVSLSWAFVHVLHANWRQPCLQVEAPLKEAWALLTLVWTWRAEGLPQCSVIWGEGKCSLCLLLVCLHEHRKGYEECASASKDPSWLTDSRLFHLFPCSLMPDV